MKSHSEIPNEEEKRNLQTGVSHSVIKTITGTVETLNRGQISREDYFRTYVGNVPKDNWEELWSTARRQNPNWFIPGSNPGEYYLGGSYVKDLDGFIKEIHGYVPHQVSVKPGVQFKGRIAGSARTGARFFR